MMPSGVICIIYPLSDITSDISYEKPVVCAKIGLFEKTIRGIKLRGRYGEIE